MRIPLTEEASYVAPQGLLPLTEGEFDLA